MLFHIMRYNKIIQMNKYYNYKIKYLIKISIKIILKIYFIFNKMIKMMFY
jgi:hypothetical protein